MIKLYINKYINRFLIFLLERPTLAAAGLQFAIFAALFFYTEMAFQLLTGAIGTGFFRAMFFHLLGAALLALITLSIPKRAAFAVAGGVSLSLSILYISQLLYNKIFHEFFSIEKIATGGEAIAQFKEVLFSAIVENILGILLLLLLLPAAVLLLLYRLRRFPTSARLPAKYALLPAIFLLAWHFLLLIPVAQDPYSARAARYGQGEQSRISSVREVGLFITMEIDLLSRIIDTKPAAELSQLPRPPIIHNPPPLIPYPTDTPPNQKQPQVPEWAGKYNAIEIDFKALIQRSANNKGLVQLHEYFRSLEPSNQNEKTGVFEGYNLITICAESFSQYVISPGLTPTLYMMQQDGINFTNFYSIYGGGTIGGEFSLITGFSPRGGELWCGKAAQKYLPFTFAAQFNSLGVQPYAYHSGNYTYYDRHKLFPDLGYIYKARSHGLEIAGPNWHVSDKELIELTIDDYIGDDRFYAHYMTLSGHPGFSFGGNPLSKKNYEAVKDLPYSTTVKAYIACQLELEYALEYLLQRLNEAGIAERTLIVLTTDHYPYGLTLNENKELAGGPLDAPFELYKNTCLIYAQGMQPQVVKAPAFVPDIVPTVSNLLGFRFDSRFLSGRDVFSEAPPLVFMDSGFITDIGIYNNNSGAFTPYEGIEAPEGYYKAIANIIKARKSAVEQIVKLDYFAEIKDYFLVDRVLAPE